MTRSSERTKLLVMGPTSSEEIASVQVQSKSQSVSRLRAHRAILLGLFLIPVNTYFLLYMECVTFGGTNGMGGPYPTTISIFANAIFFLLVLTGANHLYARRFPKSALTRSELLIIYVMLTINTAIVSIDFMDVLVPMLTYPLHGATPQNEWAKYILPHIPHWLMVTDQAAIKGWYEGYTNMYRWEILRAWVTPVCVWSGLIFVMLFVMFCINTIVRQQWMEHDRLQFPIVELPMAITEPGHHLFKNKLMWAGFSISASITLINGLSLLFPSIPYINVHVRDISPLMVSPPWNSIGYTPISFYPYAIGLGFLLPLDMLFSCWFFFIMWRVLRIAGAIYGVNSALPDFPFMREQALGAYYLVAIFALWSGRKHLAGVLRTAFKGEKNDDEANGRHALQNGCDGSYRRNSGDHGVLSLCRPAVVAVCCMYVHVFLGRPGCSSMHAEFGPPSHDLAGIAPQQVLTDLFGTRAFGADQMTGLSWFWWFNRAYRAIPIAYQLDGMKMAQRSGTSQRRAAFAMAVASVAAVVSCFWIYLHFGYQRGASVGMCRQVPVFGEEAFGYQMGNWIAYPTSANIPAGLAIAWGMIFTFFLYTMKLQIPWWPFHPLGFAVSASYSIGPLWLPLMIAWAAKLVSLKVGGMRTYRVAQSFFLGLILGDFVMGYIWPPGSRDAVPHHYLQLYAAIILVLNSGTGRIIRACRITGLWIIRLRALMCRASTNWSLTVGQGQIRRYWLRSHRPVACKIDCEHTGSGTGRLLRPRSREGTEGGSRKW